jgi:hypothetical protein
VNEVLRFVVLFAVLVQSTSEVYIYDNQSLPAKELRRYLYKASGEVAVITGSDNPLNISTDPFIAITTVEHASWLQQSSSNCTSAAIAAVVDQGLGADEFVLTYVHPVGGGAGLIVAAGTKTSRLYGVYALIERITAIRFAIHGDLLPDRAIDRPDPESLATLIVKWARLHLDEVHSPGDVTTRGLQPFHDFATGPDWWDADEYKAVFENMAKLRMNFLGLHNYNGGSNVWTGLAGDFDPLTGNVTAGGGGGYANTLFFYLLHTPYTIHHTPYSYTHTLIPHAYPYACIIHLHHRYANTCTGGVWGGAAMNTSAYLFGAQLLYSAECYTARYQQWNDVGVMFKVRSG